MAYVNGKRVLFGRVGRSGRAVLLDRLVPHIEPPEPTLGLAMNKPDHDALPTYDDIYYAIVNIKAPIVIHEVLDLTEEAYEALTEFPPDTLYIIKNDTGEIVNVMVGTAAASSLYKAELLLWTNGLPYWWPSVDYISTLNEFKTGTFWAPTVTDFGIYIPTADPSVYLARMTPALNDYTSELVITYSETILPYFNNQSQNYDLSILQFDPSENAWKGYANYNNQKRRTALRPFSEIAEDAFVVAGNEYGKIRYVTPA